MAIAVLTELSDTELHAPIDATYKALQAAPGLLAWIDGALERPLQSADLTVRSWPKAPVGEPGLNGRFRGIATVGSAKLNGNKGAIAGNGVLTPIPKSPPKFGIR